MIDAGSLTAGWLFLLKLYGWLAAKELQMANDNMNTLSSYIEKSLVLYIGLNIPHL